MINIKEIFYSYMSIFQISYPMVLIMSEYNTNEQAKKSQESFLEKESVQESGKVISEDAQKSQVVVEESKPQLAKPKISPTLLLQQIIDSINKLDSKIMLLLGKIDELANQLEGLRKESKGESLEKNLQTLTALLLTDVVNRLGLTQQPGSPAQVTQQISMPSQPPRKSEPAIEEEGLIKPSKIFKRRE